MALLSIPGTARADRSRVYVGIGIGTAAAVGGGIVSWNISYSRQVKKQEPLREPSRSIAGLKFEKESLSASPIPSRFGPAPSLWFELPLLQLQW
jgi:hypothetical protein